MPMWFIVFVGICAVFGFVGSMRALRRGGWYIWGKRVAPSTIILVMIVIVIVFGIAAAVQLGFIADHAP